MNAEERDAYLQSALRHAPDAALGPAPALSEAILKQARAKLGGATSAAAPKRGTGWLVVWDWLARPSVATGFAGVMVVVTLGMMWWDRPLDQALPHRPDHAPVTVATAPAAPPAAARAPEEAKPAALKAEPAAKAKKLNDPRTLRATKESAGSAERERTVERQDAAEPLRQSASPASMQARVLAQNQPAPSADAATAAPPMAPAPALAKAAASEKLAAGALASSDDKVQSKPARRSLSAAGVAPAPGAFARREAAHADVLEKPAAATPPSDRALLSALRAAVAADPSRWAWQRADGAAHSMDEAVLAWLSRLDDAARDGWQPRGAETAAPRGRELRLLREGRVVHSLRLVGNAVWWDRDGAAPLQAELPPATLRMLQGTLDAAAP